MCLYKVQVKLKRYIILKFTRQIIRTIKYLGYIKLQNNEGIKIRPTVSEKRNWTNQ